jgi:peroxiredoxin Q/BCP
MDPPKAQQKFVDKFDFPYPMLCDEAGDMVRAYEAWGPKKFMGREYEGISRIAYLIGADGTIEAVYPSVKTKSFAADVLASL